LAEALQQSGWTAQGLLLPGYGPELADIEQRGCREWLNAIENALYALQAAYDPVLLVGYSMGAALSIAVAADHPPDGLVLLAPFWRSGSWLQQAIAAAARPFLPRYVRLLRWTDLDDPEMRQVIRKYLPQVDLDDPGVRKQVRRLRVPVSVLYQVVRAGQEGYRKAPVVRAPTLVVQGTQDRTAKPSLTHRLVARFREMPCYVPVNADHDLINPLEPDWPRVERAVLDFAHDVLSGTT
jgi:carboxylesterase